MGKKTLYKLFYADPSAFNAEYDKRFNDENTIHLDIKIGEHSAFVCESAEIFKLIISIERTNNSINRICSNLPGIALSQFQQRCLIDEIVLTNNIEGVHSTRKEISEILQDLSKNNKRERFVGLVKKYVLLMKNETLSLQIPEDIRKIYDDIFYEEIKATDSDDLPDGQIFRKSDVGVYSPTGKKIHDGLFPESKIISVMKKSLDFLNNSNYDFLLRIAVFHYLFGYIHPFYDGNGRTSRFISSYLLSQGLNKLIGYRISFTIKENINKYYEAFKICNHYSNRGDLTPFAEMFLQMVDISMKQLYQALAERSEKLIHYVNLITQLPNADDESMCRIYDYLIQAALFSNIGISQKELEYEMGLSYNTVRSRLKRIPEELLITNKQRNRSFYLLHLKSVDELLK
ncbi:MAG: Fic family protein [Oscillospiraceae bacterium]|nr:Fic family protein [Oscillospiraceae bacterium]